MLPPDRPAPNTPLTPIAHQPSIDHQRNPPPPARPGDFQYCRTSTGELILERLSRPLEPDRALSLLNGDFDTGDLGIVHLCQIRRLPPSSRTTIAMVHLFCAAVASAAAATCFATSSVKLFFSASFADGSAPARDSASTALTAMCRSIKIYSPRRFRSAQRPLHFSRLVTGRVSGSSQ